MILWKIQYNVLAPTLTTKPQIIVEVELTERFSGRLESGEEVGEAGQKFKVERGMFSS